MLIYIVTRVRDTRCAPVVFVTEDRRRAFEFMEEQRQAYIAEAWTLIDPGEDRYTETRTTSLLQKIEAWFWERGLPRTIEVLRLEEWRI